MTYPPVKRVFAAFEGRSCPVLSSLPLYLATITATAAARPVGVGRLPPPPHPHPTPFLHPANVCPLWCGFGPSRVRAKPDSLRGRLWLVVVDRPPFCIERHTASAPTGPSWAEVPVWRGDSPVSYGLVAFPGC